MAEPLVTPDEVREWLGRDDTAVPDGRAVLAVRVVEGWLRGATGLAEWPDPVPEALWSACLELAGLAVDNPTSRSQSVTGDESDGWFAARRAEILAGVTAALRTGGTPSGSFPDPVAWP
ncbi:hypothetical protein WDZ16_12965 [Pseudokineococcus marinus]|uniref:Uncharacterized protein n=1 Tax=Pseudokineococcus marinus TaxID=351215 RepID=A0A849BJV8_9ACTN|nr:hypothetical protein [Pseudokineococcus marinus]NNH21645.1 hypothetical protein [Pseudokineococcus marinus]